MVRKEENCYYCEECNLAFLDKKKACECEENCRKNKTCDLEIIKHALTEREAGT